MTLANIYLNTWKWGFVHFSVFIILPLFLIDEHEYGVYKNKDSFHLLS